MFKYILLFVYGPCYPVDYEFYPYNNKMFLKSDCDEDSNESFNQYNSSDLDRDKLYKDKYFYSELQ
jgi:hypothetical protein